MPEKEIIVRFKLPSTLRWRWVLGTIAAIVAFGAIAYAAADFVPFNPLEPLTSSKMNMNFQVLLDRISASTSVGDIVPSFLTEPQFQSLRGTTWVLADGRSAAGTQFQVVTGLNNLPDLRGMFLRGSNNGGSAAGLRVDGNENPDGVLALGSFQGDMFASHYHGYIHPWSGGSASDPSTPGQQTGGNRDVHHASDTAGGNETRSKNVTVNYFVRIN